MRVKKQSLAIVTAESLRKAITKGVWKNRLPGELTLAKNLGVSRSTLRQALAIMRNDGYLATSQGRQSVICKLPDSQFNKRKIEQIHILAPFPMERMPNYVIFWIDALRSQLHEASLSLTVHAGSIYYKQQSTEALSELVNGYSAGCWVLVFSEPAIQYWFQEKGVPAVIAGLPAPGIRLPYVSVDHEATMFHAVGRLTSKGHRRIAMIARSSSSPGLKSFLAAFEQTCTRMGKDKVDGQIILMKKDCPAYVGRQLLNCLNFKDPITAFIIGSPLHTITAFSHLPEHGIRIPRDVSIVTTYGDHNLHHLSPNPSRYFFDAHVFGNKIFDCITKLASGLDLTNRRYLVVPEPVQGASIGNIRTLAQPVR
jgi:DNA-binding LacI/PurR family transcriptional regulator